jgi:hypothetical protein
VLRQVPTSGNPSTPTLEGSVQILWPLFRTAVEDPIKLASCSKAVSWPIAVFDLLLTNTDRKADNWGTIDGLPRVVLIDHGHAFQAEDSQSAFVELHRDQPVPRGLLKQIESFTAGKEHSSLRNVLDRTECDAVFDRASRILKHKTLTIR